MLRDVQLNEAHESLMKMPREHMSFRDLANGLNELTSITMVLLRTVDLLQETLTHLRRN